MPTTPECPSSSMEDRAPGVAIDDSHRLRRHFTVRWAASLVSLLLLWTVACGEGSILDPEGWTDLTLEVEPDPAEGWSGETIQMTATVRNGSGEAVSGYTVDWSSDDPAVAEIDGDGVVTFGGVGTTTVHATATSSSGSELRGDSNTQSHGKAPEEVEITPSSATLSTGSTVDLDATLLDGSGDTLDKSPRWKSSDTSVATVDDVGTVEAVSGGDVLILAEAGPVADTADVSISSSSGGTPAMPENVSVTETSRTDSEVTYRAEWSASAGADTYDWSAGSNSGSWGTEGSGVTSLEVTFTAPRSSSGDDSFFCVRAVNEAGASENGCTGFTVPGTSSGSSATRPNEPDTYSSITARPFDAREESGWGALSSSNFTIDQDVVAPESPSNVGEMFYPAGQSGGTAPGHTWTTFSGRSNVYVHHWLKLSDPFTNHDVGTKVLFIVADDVEGGGNPVFTFLSGGSSFNYEVRLQGSNEGARNLTSNLTGDASLTVGRWHEIETLLIGNTPGVNDGEVHVWIDGVKTHEFHDVGFFPGTSAGDFDRVKWNPYYGGMGGSVPQDQYMWMDHLHMSGQN